MSRRGVMVIVGALSAMTSAACIGALALEGVSYGPGGSDAEAGVDSPSTTPRPELCLDGVDNDDNGLVDCADPACAADFECRDEAPAGWGWVELFGGVGFSACADGREGERYLGGATAGAASCTPCICGPPSPFTCNATPHLWHDQACASQATATPLVATATCTSVNVAAVNGGSIATTIDGGDCPADGGALVEPWDASFVACGQKAASRGCPAGKVCARKGPSGCLAAGPGAACPATYDRRVEAFRESDKRDDRACGACACNKGKSCDPTFRIFDVDGCGGVPKANLGSGCTPVAGDGGILAYIVDFGARDAAAPCAPEGGAPSGSISFGPATTFCCGR